MLGGVIVHVAEGVYSMCGVWVLCSGGRGGASCCEVVGCRVEGACRSGDAALGGRIASGWKAEVEPSARLCNAKAVFWYTILGVQLHVVFISTRRHGGEP